MRALIGLATAKRGHELLTMFNSMLSGSPLLPSKSAQEQFEAEFVSVENDLGEAFSESVHQGAWMLVIRPSKFSDQLFEDDIHRFLQQIMKNYYLTTLQF